MPSKNIDFNQNDVARSVSERFEKVVASVPNHLAIESCNVKFTYDQLNQLANRIARTVISYTSTPKIPIAIILEHDANYIAAMLAILKAGYIYVPIDPTFPLDRNQLILEDSQANLIVTNNKNKDSVKNLIKNGQTIINIDEIKPSISSENLNLKISTDSPSYLIYTSGSTGKPKGILQSHQNLIHNCLNQTIAYEFTQQDRMPLIHSMSVMGAVRVIYNALLNGMSLFPVDIKSEGVNELIHRIHDNKITVFHSVATVFRNISINFTNKTYFPYIRLIILGGEAANQRDIDTYKKYFPDSCVATSGLGSSETGTISVFKMNKNFICSKNKIPVGYPVSNTQVFLLDDFGNPTSNGKVGEICVKSKYLALSYWNDKALTESSFRSVDLEDKSKVYRSGDLGMFDTDGCLYHMGRKDFQVKIRGHRVETTEVEYYLQKNPKISNALVTIEKDTLNENALVAYIIYTDKNQNDVQLLKKQLSETLPPYMIPRVFISIDSFPQTVNGKLDRLSLPKPNWSALTNFDTANSFASKTEKKLWMIWSRILAIGSFNVDDSFFDIGGDSMLCILVISDIEKDIGLTIGLRDFYENDSVRSLASYLENDAKNSDETNIQNDLLALSNQMPQEYIDSILPFTKEWEGERKSDSSLIFGKNLSGNKQPLFWCFQTHKEFQQLAKHLGTDQPIYGMRSGHVALKRTLNNIKMLGQHYAREISLIDETGPYLLGGNCQSAIVMFYAAKALQQRNKKISLLCQMEKLIELPYDAPMALIYGEKTFQKIISDPNNPQLNWQNFYTNDVNLRKIDGRHYLFFNDKNIPSLAKTLKELFATYT